MIKIEQGWSVAVLLILFFYPISGLALTRLDFPVRVRVFSRYSPSELSVSGEGLTLRAESRAVSNLPLVSLSVSGRKVRLVQPDLGEFHRICIDSSGSPMSVATTGVETRRFLGRLCVEVRDGHLWSVLEVPRETYVRGVLEGEMPGDFPIEAQKAQAVLIRSYARAQRGRHASEGYDFCDLTHCQVYGGTDVESGLRDEAVRATRSLVLTYAGKPAETLFHSTCGGHTSANQMVFGGRPLPYLQGVDDGTYCKASPHSEWSARLPLAKISSLVASDQRYVSVAPLSGLTLSEREPGGRVFSLRLDGPQKMSLPTMDFLSLIGRGFGWNQLKSNWFDVEVREGVVEFHGRGLGHGVGLCQWGARGMAEVGKRFDEILRHYFPGTKLERR